MHTLCTLYFQGRNLALDQKKGMRPPSRRRAAAAMAALCCTASAAAAGPGGDGCRPRQVRAAEVEQHVPRQLLLSALPSPLDAAAPVVGPGVGKTHPPR